MNLSIYKQNGVVSKFPLYENEVLELFPLRRSLEIASEPKVKALLQAYLIYKYSAFNLCLTGNAKQRDQLSRALSYLPNSSHPKILLSTLVDINDLQGTYEQVSAHQHIDTEKTIEDAMAGEEQNGFESEETKFVFVESQMIKSLRDSSNLVYVEVPNDSIAERIEKGLKEVYTLARKIVIGVDSLNPRKSTISKFIPIDLSQLAESQADPSKTYAVFP